MSAGQPWKRQRAVMDGRIQSWAIASLGSSSPPKKISLKAKWLPAAYARVELLARWHIARSSGTPAGQALKALRQDAATMLRWQHAFLAGGIDALRPKFAGGRPRTNPSPERKARHPKQLHFPYPARSLEPFFTGLELRQIELLRQAISNLQAQWQQCRRLFGFPRL